MGVNYKALLKGTSNQDLISVGEISLKEEGLLACNYTRFRMKGVSNRAFCRMTNITIKQLRRVLKNHNVAFLAKNIKPSKAFKQGGGYEQ